jgi:hypothetical protein
MHKAMIWYDINGTTAEATLAGGWITSQTFDSGNAIIYIKDTEDGTIQGTFEVRKYFVLRIDREAK